MKKNEKFLALLLSVVMILTCFVGTVTVSAEDATTPTATIVIKADDVEAGAKQIPVTFTVTSTLGINEALIKVSSNLGDIIAQPTVVADCPADIDNAGNATDYNSFFLSAKSPEGQPDTVMGEIKTATISAVFVNEAGLVAGETYTVDVEIPEGKVIAASAGEVAIKLECTKYEFTVEEVAACDHVNATKTLSKVTETEFVYDLDCPDCDEENLTSSVSIGTPLSSPVTISKTIEPRNDVSILLEIPSTAVASYSNLTVVVTKEEYDSDSTEVKYAPYYLTDSWASTVYKGYTEFKFSKINAYEMNNAISFVLYGMDSNGDMIKLGTLNYSVADYVVNQVSKKISGTVTAALKTTLVDMLIYGSKVQIYGKFNVANLAVNRLSGVVETGTNKDVMEYATPESEWAKSSADVPCLADTTTYNLDNSTPAGKLGLSKSLLLSNKVNTLFVITKHGTADINDIYIKYEYYDVQGNLAEPLVAKYEGSIFQNQYPQYIFDAAPVSVYDYPIKATVYYGDPNSDGVALAYANYSVANYISKYIATGTVDFQNALKSLNAYAKSLAILANVNPYVG